MPAENIPSLHLEAWTDELDSLLDAAAEFAVRNREAVDAPNILTRQGVDLSRERLSDLKRRFVTRLSALASALPGMGKDSERLAKLVALLGDKEDRGVVTLGWENGSCCVWAGDDGDFQESVGFGDDLAAALDDVELEDDHNADAARAAQPMPELRAPTHRVHPCPDCGRLIQMWGPIPCLFRNIDDERPHTCNVSELLRDDPYWLRMYVDGEFLLREKASPSPESPE
jgi:hypothetical protein